MNVGGYRQFQTTIAGARVICSRAVRDPFDHVITAITSARAGRRTWIKSRMSDTTALRRQPTDDHFYSIEFFVDAAGNVRVVVYGWHYIITDLHTCPSWVGEIVRLAQRVLTSTNNPQPTIPEGATPSCPTPSST